MPRVLLLLVALLTACSSPPATVPATPVAEASTTQARPVPGSVQSFKWDGLARSYRIHLPADFDATREYPLLLVLHAAGQGAWHIERLSGFNALSDARGFIAVYGQSTAPPQGGTPVWNAGSCCGYASESISDIDDVGYAKEVVAQMSDFYRIDRDRVFVTGMSNGGMLAHRLACEASDVFHGFAAVAAAIQVAACEPSQKLPVLIVHGTADGIVPYAGGKTPVYGLVVKPVEATFAEWGAREECDGDLITTSDKNVDTMTFERCDQPVRLMRINGGGHVWPPWTAQIVTDFFQL